MPYTIQILILILVFSTNAKAQNYYDEKKEKEYAINKNTKRKIIKAYLKQQNATDIEFNENQNTDMFPSRVKNKQGNWVLYHYDWNEDLFLKKEGEVYSFEFPSPEMEKEGYTLAKKDDLFYLVDLSKPKIECKIGFDELIPRIRTDSSSRYNSEIEDIEYTPYTYIRSFAVKKDNKWGLIEISNGNLFLSRYFLYNTPEEVPSATRIESYQLRMIENVRKNFNIDLIIPQDNYGYYLLGRDKDTKQLGLFSGESEVFYHIPAKYDSIIRHRNPQTYEVWKDGKVGYYNGAFKLVFKPTFDDFEYVHLDYTKGCALKKNGEWGLYETHKNEKIIEGTAKSVDELLELWWER